jgi:hypothetical protein
MTLAFVDNGVITGYPVSLYDVRLKFPTTSFPSNVEDVDLSSFGVVKIEQASIPAYNSNIEKVEEGTPELKDGSWKQTWNVVKLNADELAAIEENKISSARSERNGKLQDCDWTQLSDSPVDKAAWAAYRQALRDVPSQDGFPWSIVWPEEP